MHNQLLNQTRSALRAMNARKLLLSLVCALCFASAGCKNETSNQNASPQPTPSPTPSIAFDGQRAFEHVRKQVDFGPRPAGSAELAKTREYIIGELKSYGLTVTTDEFSPQTPVGVRKMANITAELPGELSEAIIISSHYDTKLFKEFRFVGANDAGSSTGALLEIARVLAARGQKPRYTYWFVFFDGEEAFCKGWDECKVNGEQDNTYGSRRFVEQLKQKNEVKRVRSMILLDMIGYEQLILGRESEFSSAWLNDIIWRTARETGYSRQFVDFDDPVGADDHEPFRKVGIDAVDLIQLNSYPFWHTEGDTLDKISPQSLKVIGDVIIASLPRIEQHLAGR
jgi:Zn-dependent M28 family amino/carboxypeptidase